jgi:hypothetical protein
MRITGFRSGNPLTIRSTQIKSPPPRQKTECEKNPDSLECLEEQLSNLRSSGGGFDRRGNLNIIGGDVSRLQALIQKKRMIC